MDWDARYIAGDTPWDKGAASPAITEILKRHPFTGDVWIPGTGIGHDARFIAEQCPHANVQGFDISKTAINQARTYQLPKNLLFVLADIFKMADQNGCDVWFEHTCYCAISPGMRPQYVEAASKHIKPGGVLAGIFFVDTGFDPDQGPPFFSEENDIIRKFSYHFQIIESWIPQNTYAGREGREKIFILERN